MAKNKRGRNYKFTPRRKAALIRAQAKSAAKRRRRGVAVAGVVAATLVAGGIAGAVGSRRVSSARRQSRQNAFLQTLPKPQLALPSGKGKRTVVQAKIRSPHPKVALAKTTDKTIFKVGSNGLITRTTKKRLSYDTNRRRSYWQAKPVGGSPRKPYTSTKRGRR